ncbi:MAG: permease-like cell division protein FtsX [Oscillospiraceae bacterium]|nr:permease-like cell division protein FtsX [Oscillospiraceae bacterium]
MRASGVRYLLGKGIENIWKNRMMAFASFCVLLISLLLVGLSVLVSINISSMIGGVEDKNEVVIYLQEDTTDMEISEIYGELIRMDNVAEANFYSKEEAFEDMKNNMSDYEMVFDSLGEDNPLIDAYRVRVSDISKIDDTLVQINALEHVESVRAPMDFVNILKELRQILTMICGVIITALIIISIVIIANTTKASVFARRAEIQIMKYVGATNSFIRIPFFVEGMITGFFAGCAALAVTWLGYDALIDLLTRGTNVIAIFGMTSIVQFEDVAIPVIASYLTAGTFFGALGTVFSTRKHLNV